MYSTASNIVTKEFKLDIQVLKRFADAFYENHATKKTHLHLISRLRWDSFIKYLNWLQHNRYIECKDVNGVKLYLLTELGREMFGKLLKFLEISSIQINNF